MPARVARVAAIFPLENGPTLRPRQLYKRRGPVKRAINPRYHPRCSPCPCAFTLASAPTPPPPSPSHLFFESATDQPTGFPVYIYRPSLRAGLSCFIAAFCPGYNQPSRGHAIDRRVAFSEVNETWTSSPSSPFQVGSPSFRAKSLDHSRFHRSSSLFLSFPMLMLTNACSIRFLFLLSFPFLFFFSLLSTSEEIIRGVENGTIWSNCSEQLGEKLARIRSSPLPSSLFPLSILARSRD